MALKKSIYFLFSYKMGGLNTSDRKLLKQMAGDFAHPFSLNSKF
ncbi:hypothetical protein B4091_2300 [Bacillus licheniformis]|nr:hypothetical protein B4091_2300 [Bacillus licheniformis]